MPAIVTFAGAAKVEFKAVLGTLEAMLETLEAILGTLKAMLVKL
jgi:hypothetical protein